MTILFDREHYLQDKLNSFLEQDLGLPGNDYYSNLDIDGFLQLKSVLSSINNILTLKVSLSFAHWVTKQINLNQETENRIVSQIKTTKPNANGFDIEISEPVKLIAEVKCNVPVNEGIVYGAAQKNGINKDIQALINGKNKSPIHPKDYLKFMVFLDKPKIKKATEHFVKNMKSEKERVVFVDKNTKTESTENVYIIYVEI